MDPFTIILAIVGSLAALGLAIIRFLKWRKKSRVQEERQAESHQKWQQMRDTEGLMVVRPVPLGSSSAMSNGRTMFVGVGSFGMNAILRQLIAMTQLGLDDQVGVILIINYDERERDEFEAPESFQERIVYASCRAYSGGMSARNPAEVRQGIGEWGPATEKAIAQACDQHLRRYRGSAPSSILLAFSGGAHAAIGSYTTKLLHANFDEARIFGITALPKEQRSRTYFGQEYTRFMDAGLHGAILIEGMGEDVTTVDTALAYMMAGFSNSGPLNNYLTHCFPDNKHGFLIFQIASSHVPAWKAEELGCNFSQSPSMSYLTYKELVIREFIRNARLLEKDKGLFSARFPTSEPGTVMYDLFMSNLAPDDFYRLEDGIAQSLKSTRDEGNIDDEGTLFARRHVEGNYKLIYAPMVHDFDPTHPNCHVWAIRLLSVQMVDSAEEGPKTFNEVFGISTTAPLLTENSENPSKATSPALPA